MKSVYISFINCFNSDFILHAEITTMKVAIPCDGDEMESEVSMHFGRARYCAFITIENGEIKKQEVLPLPSEGHEYGDLPSFVKKNGADMIIAYGMGERAQMLFNEMGINVITGVRGKIKELVKMLIEGNLISDEKWKEHGDFGQHEHE